MKRNHIWGAIFILAGVLFAAMTFANPNTATTNNAAFNMGQMMGSLLIPGILVLAGIFRMLKTPPDKSE